MANFPRAALANRKSTENIPNLFAPACAPAYVENRMSNLTERHQHRVMTRPDTVPNFALATAR